jgi:hypothetical protein
MQPRRMRELGIEVENPSPKWVTLWKHCRFRPPMTIPWGSYWRHRGMDLQDAWDCVSEVVQDVHDRKINALSEELFLPRTFDDPLNLFRKLGWDRALELCLGLSGLVLDGKSGDFDRWRREVGLKAGA